MIELNKKIQKKRKQLSFLAKHYFNTGIIKEKPLQIKLILNPQLLLPNFNYYTIEGDLVFCDKSDDENYNIQVFIYPFAFKQVESVELEKDNNDKASLITIKIREYEPTKLHQMLPLSIGIERLLQSEDPYARKVADLVKQIDKKMREIKEISSQNNYKDPQFDSIQSDTAASFLEAYHRKLYIKAQKIIDTHPFYIIRLAKSKGMLEEKLKLKLVEISPKLLEILKIDLETGMDQLLHNK